MKNFKYYNHLGFQNPYFLRKERINIYPNFKDLILEKESDNYIDFVSIVQILNYNYCLGNRTLIKGIHKSPWMAKPSEDKKSWDYFDVPDHDEQKFGQEYIANHLFELLKEELLEYIGGKSNIGVLLTGGMDSRITACVLNDLIDNNEISGDIKVLGITWGLPSSRDVKYASKIARKLNWEWKHFKIDADQLYKNIKLTVQNGCEFSPIHLHAMPKVAEMKDIDCVIASSFGDSIGRGEYSSKGVTELKSLINKSRLTDVAGILRSDFLNLTYKKFKEDVSAYRKLFPQQKRYQQLEQDYQLHYMRRMLNPCMSVIDKKIPLFQMFTAPKVFGFMWSLHPKLRNDNIYKIILEEKNRELLKIPWARTGLVYPKKNGKPMDDYTSKHTDYNKIIRNDLLPNIKDKILSETISQLNIFDMKALSTLIKLCRRIPIKSYHFYEAKLIWIASLSDFIDEFGIKSEYNQPPTTLRPNFGTYSKYFKRYMKQIILDKYI